ncbi:MAG: glycosyltransferase family 1 protein [Methanosphaera sp.]|uniref:glycosyltransferase n=1 Tax=Methanosphaera sp. TaxID=2666342 RepID=UPI0025D6FE61|nr:glycosyltransferase [Methanosphaera sp.]MCI5867183.1 glycosyltransferase family 1 protein [Methanosphaera sp.]MDD6534749.1 glycosyltransferase family 1 protein [Methanosphaera sp.]MDY3955583.1 glycosyltransferase family 1 protein [Methanosphaera sp.]
MKLLVFVTGRGIGGDAVTAYNITEALNDHGIDATVVLDPSAPGYYFKKRNVEWLKCPIPAAGGHAASKKTLIKAAFKSIKAALAGRSLIKQQNADGVIGVIGGGLVIGCLSAKLAGVPSIGVAATPTDTKMSLMLNPTLLLPESTRFTDDNVESKYDVKKQYSPIKTDIVNGDYHNIIDKMPENFNPEHKSVLFSSGSTLFDDMAKAARKFAEENDDVNIFIIGAPLHDGIDEIIDHPNIINLGYINYIKDLYDLIDLAVITDDGLTLHETIACKLPVVVVIGVKYGRYHALSKVFNGAVLESHVDDITEKVSYALEHHDEMQTAAANYSDGILNGLNDLVAFVKKHIREK